MKYDVTEMHPRVVKSLVDDLRSRGIKTKVHIKKEESGVVAILEVENPELLPYMKPAGEK